MTSEGEVIAPDLQRLVWRIKAGGAESIGLLGSTGTCMFLSHDQRRRAVAAAVEAVASIPIIVGVGAMRTDEAQALARDAAEEGASGLLLALVSYRAADGRGGLLAAVHLQQSGHDQLHLQARNGRASGGDPDGGFGKGNRENLQISPVTREKHEKSLLRLRYIMRNI
ncbi:dihydrodipicolinate synthase family protein [Brevundimonas naejangsanensis]